MTRTSLCCRCEGGLWLFGTELTVVWPCWAATPNGCCASVLCSIASSCEWVVSSRERRPVRACHPGTVQAFLWMNKQMLSSPDKPWPAPVLRPPTPSPNPAPTAPRASPLAASSSSFRGSSSSDGGSNGNPTSSNTGSEALSQLQLDEAEELGEGVTGVVLGGRCVQCVCVVRTPALSAVQCSAVQLGCLLPCWPSFAA